MWYWNHYFRSFNLNLIFFPPKWPNITEQYLLIQCHRVAYLIRSLIYTAISLILMNQWHVDSFQWVIPTNQEQFIFFCISQWPLFLKNQVRCERMTCVKLFALYTTPFNWIFSQFRNRLLVNDSNQACPSRQILKWSTGLYQTWDYILHLFCKTVNL